MTLRTVLLLFVVWMAFTGCAEKLICPAYQSAFIHDKNALRQKFSYFENDTTPKVYTASKNKYLVAEPESYRKLYRRMQTVPMQEQRTVLPDSLAEGPPAELPLDSLATDSVFVQAPIDSLATAQADSLNTDSVYVITKDREVRILRYNFPDSLHRDSTTGRYVKETPKYYVDEVGYNQEQVNYMWYFRKQLILPDARLAKLEEAKGKAEQTAAKKKKKFFQKLMFWKKFKKKSKSDSVEVKPTALDPNDSIFNYETETDSVGTVPQQPIPVKAKKKGVMGLLKRKEKPAKTTPDQPARKEDEEDKN
jgi:hypothetical protein